MYFIMTALLVCYRHSSVRQFNMTICMRLLVKSGDANKCPGARLLSGSNKLYFIPRRAVPQRAERFQFA
jgi:hypothetical protein